VAAFERCSQIADSSTTTTSVHTSNSAPITTPRLANPVTCTPRSTPLGTESPGSHPLVPEVKRSASFSPNRTAAPNSAPRNWPSQSKSSSPPRMSRANQRAKLNIGLARAPITPIEIAVASPNPIANSSRFTSRPSTIIPGPPIITIVVPTNSAPTFLPHPGDIIA
jgi:hypothetical protein